jgi:hypothetical protein
MIQMQVGALVDHQSWGRGKILALRHPNVQAYFPSIGVDAGGPVKLVQQAVLTLSRVQSDPLFDGVDGKPAAKGGVGVRRPLKRPDLNLEQAVDWFSQEYPDRFSGARFIKAELAPKRDAHKLFVDRLGGEAGKKLLAGKESEEIGNLLDALYRATNIPSRLEIAAAHEGLKAPEAASRLLDSLQGLLDTPGPGAFGRLVNAVGALPTRHDSKVLTWPNVTLLPFLADPARFIVTKPEITKLAAGRMGLDLVYSTAVKWDTYDRVLDMSRRLLERLTPLGAKDFIDVQTFIWVTRKLK